MIEIAQALKRHLDEGTALATLHVDDEAHTAPVVFECRVVETMRNRQVAQVLRPQLTRPLWDSDRLIGLLGEARSRLGRAFALIHGNDVLVLVRVRP